MDEEEVKFEAILKMKGDNRLEEEFDDAEEALSN